MYMYLCDMISVSVIKCVVYRELNFWLRLEEIDFSFFLSFFLSFFSLR